MQDAGIICRHLDTVLRRWGGARCRTGVSSGHAVKLRCSGTDELQSSNDRKYAHEKFMQFNESATRMSGVRGNGARLRLKVGRNLALIVI
jgi:hypothetical protein